MKLNELTAHEIAAGIKAKKYKATEVAKAAITAVKKETKTLNSYISVMEEEALIQAKAVDQKVSKGDSLGTLAGVPIGIKDNMMIKGAKTTCASKILGDYKAPYNAFVVDQLKKQDAVFVGKTNLDEFAMGSSTEYSAFGAAKNPWNKDRIPGGSSGGSAVTVAARSVPLSLGSDTGGSIRQPASFCGVLGFKPTYGTVSRFGLVAFASSLDQIGPFSHDPHDMALVLEAISGNDTQDSTSVNKKTAPYLSELDNPIKGLKVGILKESSMDGTDPEVAKTIKQSADTFKKMGAKLVDVSVPHLGSSVAVYYVIAPSEASSNLARFDGMRYGFRNKDAANLIEQYNFNRRDGFGPEVKRRILIGTYALSSGYYDAYYAKAQKVRTLIKKDFDAVFKKVDVLITPTAPTPAFKKGEKLADPLQMYLSDIFSIPANLAGIPGVSVPAGFSSEKLPIGLHISANAFEDAKLLRVANAFVKETKFNLERPPSLN